VAVRATMAEVWYLSCCFLWSKVGRQKSLWLTCQFGAIY